MKHGSQTLKEHLHTRFKAHSLILTEIQEFSYCHQLGTKEVGLRTNN